MADPLYGVWDGKPFDTRCADVPVTLQELAVPTGFESFWQDNPVMVFIADRGFLVFDADASLGAAFHEYLGRAAAESCGKCTPCRVGTQSLRERLAHLGEVAAIDVELGEIAALAEHIGATSLCGLGQSCGASLVAAIRHFPEVFAKAGEQADLSAYTYVTAPCIEACPAKLDVPRYIDCIRDGRPDHALGVILDKYPLAASCGRVCVRFCEGACRRGAADGAVGIKMLKRYAADQVAASGRHLEFGSPTPVARAAAHRVAIVGAGPAGVTCAYQLLREGFQVEVFEARQAAGGMASVGIPSYRLPKDVLKAETEDVITRLGGVLHFGQRLGSDFSVDELVARGFDAVFLGFGASSGSLLGVENEQPGLAGYASGVDFLLGVHNHVERGEAMTVRGEVVVVGGGNVAMDCVRSAVRMGADKVHLIYRRTLQDMPADHEEIEAALHEGVEFHCLTNPSRLVVEDGRVIGVDLLKMRQTERDAKGRIGVEAIPDSTHFMRCDLVIAAIGQQIERGVLGEADGIEVDRWGCIKTDPDSLQTSRAGVFAGGDCVLGPLTLIHAMDQGTLAASSIRSHLLEGVVSPQPAARMQKLLARNRLLAGATPSVPPSPPLRVERTRIAELEAAARIRNFEEVELPLDKAAAYREADRCLRCYRLYTVVTAHPMTGVGIPARQVNLHGEPRI